MKKKIIIEVETECSDERIIEHTKRYWIDNFKDCKNMDVKVE